MRKMLLVLYYLIIAFDISPVEEPEILPEYLLAFPFGSDDHFQKIISGLEETTIWSQNRIMDWSQAQGFMATPDNPDGGYQYQRGLVIHPPGIRYFLIAPVTARGTRQSFGWKLKLDFAFFYSRPAENWLSTNFGNYENLLRYEIFIDNILFKTIEIGYGVSLKSPVIIEIPYIRNPSGKVTVEIRLKNHPANFAILYDSYLSLE